MTELEAVFRVPVIEAYGMTEAAHQIASNPLPPANRVPGSVSRVGCEVAIMDEHGTLLPADQPGEVAIRGSNVTDGYENNPAVNAHAFINGWFRTGDRGVIDDRGYATEGLEQLSAALFEEVLQRPGVGRHDNFFALGGDSLRAMQVAARLINALGMEIPSTTLFSSSNAGFACGRLDGVALQRR